MSALNVPISKTDVLLKAANGEFLTVAGKCSLTVELEDIIQEVELIVADQLPFPIVIGLDLQRKWKAVIDVDAATMRTKTGLCTVFNLHNITHDDVEPVNYVISETTQEELVTKDAYRIPSRSSRWLRVVIPPNFNNSNGFIEQSLKLDNRLCVAHAIVPVIDGLSMINVINLGRNNINIQKGTPVATICSVCEVATISVLEKSWQSSTKVLTPEQIATKVQEAIGRGDSSENLTEEQRKSAFELIMQYGDVIAQNNRNPGVQSKVEHNVTTEPGTVPISSGRFRLSLKQMDEINKQVNELLMNGIISPSSSPWSASVVLAVKRMEP